MNRFTQLLMKNSNDIADGDTVSNENKVSGIEKSYLRARENLAKKSKTNLSEELSEEPQKTNKKTNSAISPGESMTQMQNLRIFYAMTENIEDKPIALEEARERNRLQ